MAEYIERNKAVDAIAHLMATGFVEDRFITPHELQSLQDEIETLPAADVAPVVHGWWISWDEAGYFIPFADKFECSVCHDAAQRLYNGDDLLSPYCPNCGAKMDKEATDGLDTP